MERETEVDPLTRLWLACRRQGKLIVYVLGASLCGWVIYLTLAAPLYQSSASIHVLAEDPDYWRKATDADHAISLDEKLASQLELVRSGETFRRMIEDSDLLEQQHFIEEIAQERPGAFLAWLRTTFGKGGVADPKTEALALIETRLTVKRLGDSSVLSITYAARSPQAAAAMTGRVVQAYFDARQRIQTEAARRAVEWLSAKVEELRTQTLKQAAAIEAFRRKHGLLASEGRLIGDQRLSRMTEQLVLAQGDLGEAEARSRKLEAILAAGDMNAAVAQSLASPLVTELRQDYLEAARRGADLEAKYGAGHQQARRLKGEAEEYRRQMFEELSRIAAAYRAEEEMARGRVEALKANIGQAGAEKSDLDAEQVTLRDLENRADNARRLYLDHLARLDTARQEENLPEISAKLISPPTVPATPSSPRKALSLFVAFCLGLGSGLAVAALRDFSDRKLRRPDQLRRVSGAPVLGLIPLIERAPAFHPDFTAFPISRPDSIRMADAIDRHAFDNPRSRMTDVIRRTLAHQTPLEKGRSARVVGVVSCEAGEGKTTIAANLASLSALKGQRTLLVDADHVNPEASRRLARHVLEATERPSLFPSLLRHPSTPLSLLARPEPSRDSGPGDYDRSADMDADIEKAKGDFDLIVIDLPPLAAGHVVEDAATRVDSILLVVEWGGVTEAALAEALRNAPTIATRITGALFNKVRFDKLPLYLEGGAPASAYLGQGGYFSG
ncbi:hypothetical protein [Rhizobium sp. FKL33]|uniref:GumC family protein n=1 Tax=Rhizobium sp. FKL33 TaxID=2562307 RepID=UPI00148553BB|nr:hypothetical protein [Rhizobium sp. FKL33]